MDPIRGTITDYGYDDSGNILRKKISEWDGNVSSPVRGTALSTVNYGYTDTECKDLLTTYNGQTITYDAIGNPLNYRDGISLTWQNGRELATFSQNGTNVNYTYDTSGMRTSKTVTKDGTSTEYTYVYENGLLLQMTRGSRIYDFSYDANGTPISVAYRSRANANPTYYYYGLNSRGDVVALYTSSGTVSALYEYDAYGKLLSVETAAGVPITSETSIAIVNPLRYRGYVYDTETGFYYLQSRYYDPETCRFVNEDLIIATINGISGLNLFAYCGNNPVNSADPSGYLWDWIKEQWNKAKSWINENVSFGMLYKVSEDIKETVSYWWFKVTSGTTEKVKYPKNEKTVNMYLTEDVGVGMAVNTSKGSLSVNNNIFGGHAIELSLDTNFIKKSVSYEWSISYTNFRIETPIVDGAYTYDCFTSFSINNHHVAATVLVCVFAPEAIPAMVYAIQQTISSSSYSLT